jgi:hypothetical protein
MSQLRLRHLSNDGWARLPSGWRALGERAERAQRVNMGKLPDARCAAAPVDFVTRRGCRARAGGKEREMPLYMDVHNLDGSVTVDDVAKAHAADLERQDEHGVRYLRYWVAEQEGKIFCLVDAPHADAANTVHREAHGLVADEIFAVTEGG